MKFYIYATHSQGYYEDLLDTMRLFRADYTVDGMGTKWEGYRQKLEGILTFARAQTPNEVMSVIDAFDTLLLRNPSSLKREFRMSGKDLIYAHDHYFLYSNAIGRKYHEKKWGCAHTLLNAGASIGFASAYVKTISRILERLDREHIPTHLVDDQKELCLYYKYHAPTTNMHIDDRSHFIYLAMGLKPFMPKHHVPYLVSGPGKQSLRPYIHWLRSHYTSYYSHIPMRHTMSRWERICARLRHLSNQ